MDKNEKVAIIGAGLAGLLAGVMMRDRVLRIYEKQLSLPHNHTAVMRFRSRAVSDATNIPFRKVPVAWAIQRNRYKINDLALAMQYSWNCTGVYDPTRSIARFLSGIFVDERYVSPPDLPTLLANKLMAPITYNFDFLPINFKLAKPTISTIPMPVLAKKLGYEFQSKFRHKKGINCVALVEHRSQLAPIDCYATVYLHNHPFQRITITGDRIIAESYTYEHDGGVESTYLETVFNDIIPVVLGLQDIGFKDFQIHEQKYAKIVKIDESERKQFIRFATRQYGIYSLGRYATWRPGLLLDDLVQDIRLITDMLDGGGRDLIHNYAKGDKDG